jgi:hypothetical protein
MLAAFLHLFEEYHSREGLVPADALSSLSGHADYNSTGLILESSVAQAVVA